MVRKGCVGKKKTSKALVPVSQPGTLIPKRPADEALAGFLSEETKRAYGVDLKQFFGVKNLSRLPMERILSVTPDEVTSFRDRLLEEGKKPSTVQRKLSAIRMLYNHLIARSIVTLNPANSKLVRSPKSQSVRKTDILTWDDAIKILRSIDQSKPFGKRNYTLILLALNLGVRRSELLGIRLEDIKNGPEGAYVVIRGKGQKERFVYLRPDVASAIEGYLKSCKIKSEHLFPGQNGKPLTGRRFWAIVRRRAEIAGLKDIHPHSLRAAFITLAHQKGVPVGDIQKTVGHSRGETTLGYVRDLEMIKKSATKALGGLS